MYIDSLDQAVALLKPARLDILKRLDAPRTCPELAESFGETAQRIYYHVKALETAGLVEKVEERRVRGTVEGYYQAAARSYWLSPSLVGKIGGERTSRDQISLRYLLDLTEEIQVDVGRLARQSESGIDIPSLSLSAHIHLPDASRRAEFMQEVQSIFQHLARKYGTPQDDIALLTDEQGYRLVLACYPKTGDDHAS